ncbi:MmgE/PrpD family protein [Actinomadura chibensis]|uniref:MmgE/PrpD family protein n=1 Tax=Actinomadura chibensis TaxID=392828 RepID=A0A5D0NDS7_9ACTN|nr:MmgE/PrpD family protein [Actinomadura chibensis]TYB42449.1 MmgE/PrpD family protein [Actinomadura chibensis]
MTTTDTLAGWARDPATAVPPRVVERTRLALLDTFAAQAAGLSADGARQVADLVTHWGGRPEATVYATGARVPMHLAALANATCARAWDLDDVLEHAFSHVSGSVVPAALAVAEGVEASGRRVSGRAFLTAVAVGAEAVCRLALAPRASFSVTGASRSYECGTFGAALASARLLGLSGERTRHAMGIALSMLCGKQQAFLAGAHTVSLGQGLSAQAGVLAAVMAERGLTGAAPDIDVLEGRFGYYFTNHRGLYDPDGITAGLGAGWRVLETSVKPLYPCCKFTHTSIAATLDAMRDLGGDPDRIAEIEVSVTDREAYDLACAPEDAKRRPATRAAAQFSMPYAVAVAAVHGRVGPEHFVPEALGDERVLDVADRVVIRADLDGASDRGALPMPAHVTVRPRDGEPVSRRVTVVKGHPSAPMDFADVAEKFRACASFALPGWDGAERVVDTVRGVAGLASISALVGVLPRGSG